MEAVLHRAYDGAYDLDEKRSQRCEFMTIVGKVVEIDGGSSRPYFGTLRLLRSRGRYEREAAQGAIRGQQDGWLLKRSKFIERFKARALFTRPRSQSRVKKLDKRRWGTAPEPPGCTV